ncbi:lytic transglycosylase domain-containing protein [Celeribacter litoreus]|uniref:lytic transglycosylase domain-containing protein n=1 Tax=Celeribacter litoreus TaxID=2876714 RepID=UPI001CCACD17|nr:lytic transglycosylase domain-containing protein [Celeribacter litoreus]
MILGVLTLPGYAEDGTDPPPWPEVRPKRIGVPTGQAGNLIDIQIRPGSKTVKAPAAEEAETPAQVDLLDWYWNAVPHDLSGAGPERFPAAIAALDLDPGGAIPRPTFQQITDLANLYGPTLLLNSVGTQVSPALALAVIAVESAGDVAAESSAGARGLMQLMPATAERFGVDATIPEENIRGGITYLDWLLTEFNGDLALALAGYNAGENAVKSAGGAPLFAETRLYVPKVMAAWQITKDLCITPPDIYSDGCVFATNALRAKN